MSRLSVVIFGATGFTGKSAALELARMVRKRPELTWGVAGRSKARLEDVMKHIAETTGEDQSHVKIIVADVSNQDSLVEMCRQAHVVANCCGPFRLYGEPVVRAAIHARTHHIDVTGEPQFIESMQLKYDAEARKAGVYIVSACGFDSVPNDMGIIFLQRHFGGTVNSVESYISNRVPPHLRDDVRARGTIHSGTWESFVHSINRQNELKPLRRKLYPTRLPPFRPKLSSRFVVHKKNKTWCVPFPGSDHSVVYRTQRHLYEECAQRPVQFRAYVELKGFHQVLGLMFGIPLLAFMCLFSCTRNLLLKYPKFFSGGQASSEGPTEAVMQANQFKMELYAEGWAEGSDLTKPPNKTAVARVSGTNPGYGFTVVTLLYCALTILDEKDRMPPSGGVLTTGVAFKDTSLITKLCENGASFEMIDSKTK